MKHILAYILVVIIWSVGFSQGTKKASEVSLVPVSFPDSINLVMVKTGNTDAKLVGSDFLSVWTSLGMDHQRAIQEQTSIMRRKKYSARPMLVNYFGAIASAVQNERADVAKLTEFLNVSKQVIDLYDTRVVQKFFERSRTFFRFHALHYEKTYRLYAVNDSYRFEFIAPAPTMTWDDTATEDTKTSEDPWADYPDDNYNNDQPYDDKPVAVMPIWMTPPPPPFIDGPVIRFDPLTLNFVTRYDSVFLKDTKGTYSLLDGTFSGEQGSFDWTIAGLGPDQVQCNFTTYNFKVSSPAFQADLAKLNYTGKTPGFIPGVFEFKSVARRDSVLSSYPRFKSYQGDLAIQGFGDETMTYRGGFSLTGQKISSASVSGDPATIDITLDGEKKFTAKSPVFEFADSSFVAKNARIRIYQRNDSIVHPSVRLKYDFNNANLRIQRTEGPMLHTPYSSPFFNIDFSTDVIKWDLKSDSLDLYTEGGRGTVPMIIESVDYYDPEDFRLLKGQGFRKKYR